MNTLFILIENEFELDPLIIKMSNALSQINIKLIPITASNFVNIESLYGSSIIVFRPTLSAHEFSQNFLQQKLIPLASRKKIWLYDISAFSPLTTISHYKHFPLPAKLYDLLLPLALDYFNQKNAQTLWPGGKRSKIPNFSTTNFKKI